MAKGEHVKVEGFGLVITSVTLQTGMVDHSRLLFVYRSDIICLPKSIPFFPLSFTERFYYMSFQSNSTTTDIFFVVDAGLELSGVFHHPSSTLYSELGQTSRHAERL